MYIFKQVAHLFLILICLPYVPASIAIEPSSNTLNFNNFTPASYGVNQDSSGTVNIENAGASLRLSGNRWQQIAFNYIITADTVIEFDYSSDTEGEIHGIGFDNDLSLSAERTFKLLGSQNWGILDFDDYGNGTQHYIIPVGLFYTGAMNYLFFANDHDVSNPNAESLFSNIKVYEDVKSSSTLSNTLNFNDFMPASYGVNQDSGGTVTIENAGASLRLVGNRWQQIAFNYIITADTVIEFDYSSDTEGEIHGIGFDNDLSLSAERTFKLLGSQNWGILDFDDYGNGTQHYVIPVGLFYTGAMNYLFFANDHDVSSPNAESLFSNIEVYEDTGATVVTQPITVGLGKDYTTPAELAAADILQPGDVVEIDSGIYSADVAAWYTDNITLRGVGGMVHLRADGANAQGKAIWVISGDNTVVENIEFSGAAVADKNGAGIRHQHGLLTVRNCYFHGNEMGLLTGNDENSELIVEGSEFADNGIGNGYSHNIYVGRIKKFTLKYSYSHHTRFVTNAGHNVKSRAQQNFILYNRIMDESDGRASRQIDLPNGGRSYLIGNLIQQGAYATNSNMLGYAPEGASNTIQELYVVNNTFVNDKNSGSFIEVYGAPQLQIINNIFAGGGSVPIGNNVKNNLVTYDAGLTNPENFDYHLSNNSAAIDQGINLGVGADGFNLTPFFEYQHVTQGSARPIDNQIDIGAFEYK